MAFGVLVEAGSVGIWGIVTSIVTFLSSRYLLSLEAASFRSFSGSVAKMVFDVKNEKILCAAKTIIVHFTGIFSSATR